MATISIKSPAVSGPASISDVDLKATVAVFKAKIAAQLGIPADEQR